jgi:hypothetical protein
MSSRWLSIHLKIKKLSKISRLWGRGYMLFVENMI